MQETIDRAAIEATYRVIRPYIRRTPLLEVDAADFGLGAFRLLLKLEMLQHSGSFKVRGAFSNLLTRTLPASGVVAASGGNHGAAVAYAAMKLGVPARIFVPAVSSAAKVDRIRRYGAELSIVGERYADALAASEEWSARSSALRVHAFDQVETILGQATLGLELSQDEPAIDTIVASVGGGGLIAGIAAWHRGQHRIVGVEPEAAPTLTHAFDAGCPVVAPAGGYAADSLAPARVGDAVYPLAKAYVERVELVTDDDIRSAQRALWDVCRVVVEPGGAAGFAGILAGRYRPAPDERVAVVISGANTTAVQFA